jgi:hypothetical protein
MQESLDDHRIGSKLSIDREHYEEQKFGSGLPGFSIDVDGVISDIIV